MLTDSETQIVNRYVEEILSDDSFAVADEILAPDFVIQGLQTLRDRESVIEVQSTVVRKAFPDLTFDMEDIFGDGNKIGIRATIRGTHQGEYLGIAATGRQVEVETIMILRVSVGQIEEAWPVMDSLTWFQQLGAAPAMDWQEEG